MKQILACATLALMAGCGAAITTTSTPTPTTGGADTCNAAAYADLVGQDAVQALSLPDPKRSYRPDDAITTDFDPKRLNVQLDDTDTIVAVTCG